MVWPFDDEDPNPELGWVPGHLETYMDMSEQAQVWTENLKGQGDKISEFHKLLSATVKEMLG